MTFEEVRKRVTELKAYAEQTAAQHNMAIGRLTEAQEALAYMEKQAADALEAAKNVVAATPVAEVAEVAEVAVAPEPVAA